MIVVKVELWSARTHEVTELARMVIANDGESQDPKKGDYFFATLRGRSKEALEAALVKWANGDDNTRHKLGVRHGSIKDYPRLAIHVWNLVARCLARMDYR